MSGRPAREFVDANVLVYAFDSSAGRKREAAVQLLERLWENESGHLSVQVLQEFFVTITRTVASPLPADEAEKRVRELAAWQVFVPTRDLGRRGPFTAAGPGVRLRVTSPPHPRLSPRRR